MHRTKSLIFSVLLFLWSERAFAFRYHGRVALGVYNSTEEFKNPGASSSHNDVRNLSGRFYLGLSELGSPKLDIVADVRDKHEFFGQLTKDQLSLEERNTFQVRQLSVGDPQVFKKGFYQLGRFSVLDAGSVFNDGMEIGWRTGVEKVAYLQDSMPRGMSNPTCKATPSPSKVDCTLLMRAKAVDGVGYFD